MSPPTTAGILLAAALAAGIGNAQWLNHPDPRTPRTNAPGLRGEGKPDLSAPTPRTPDGKPDLSGVWRGARGVFKYTAEDLANNFKPGEFPMQPWVATLAAQRKASPGVGDPETRCLTEGIARLYGNAVFYPLKIIQTPDVAVILYEHMWTFRQVFLDGRKLPSDPHPTWLGYSVGRWDEDALVVDSAGFNGKTWLDDLGHATTEALHLTERFRRLDFGHMELKLTFDDPNAYTKPWTITESLELFPDEELIEYQCLENEKDLIHIEKGRR